MFLFAVNPAVTEEKLENSFHICTNTTSFNTQGHIYVKNIEFSSMFTAHYSMIVFCYHCHDYSEMSVKYDLKKNLDYIIIS